MQINELRSGAERLLNDFKVYLDKIKNDDFILDDYTNRQANETGLPGYYLCNFLERTTRDLFGSSKPAGSALSFGIKADENQNSFTIDGNDAKNHNKDNRAQAERLPKKTDMSIRFFIEFKLINDVIVD